jgi:hypothetical protein
MAAAPDLLSLVASLDAALLPCLPARELQAHGLYVIVSALILCVQYIARLSFFKGLVIVWVLHVSISSPVLGSRVMVMVYFL